MRSLRVRFLAAVLAQNCPASFASSVRWRARRRRQTTTRRWRRRSPCWTRTSLLPLDIVSGIRSGTAAVELIWSDAFHASSVLFAVVAGRELVENVERAIRLRRDRSTFRVFYFNPLFLEELFDTVDGLEKSGFQFELVEKEVPAGVRTSGMLLAPDGATLRVGSIVATGEDFEGSNLKTVKQVLVFLRTHVKGG